MSLLVLGLEMRRTEWINRSIFLERVEMNRKFKILLLIELVISAVFAVYLFAGKSDLSLNIPVQMNSWNSGDVVFSETEWRITPDQAGPETKVYSPPVSLPKGTYTLDIWYTGAITQMAKPTAGEDNQVFVEGNDFYLNKNLDHVTYMFTVAEDIDDFQFEVSYNGRGTLNITDIQIVSNNNGKRLALLKLLCVFLIIDLLIVFKRLPPQKKFAFGAVAGIALLSSLPLFFRGVNDVSGQDLPFHLMRIEGIAAELRAGHFPVRISSAWAGGHGYPVSIFYGDLLLYFPAVLRLLGVNMTVSYKVFVFMINLLTSLAASCCFSKMFRSQKTGAICVLVYMSATYRLVDVYIRSAVGEYCAILFFPIVALAAWNIYKTKNDSLRDNIKNGIILAAGMSGIVTAHILSAEMTALAIFIVFVLVIKKSLKLRSIGTYAIGVIGTLLLSAFFLVPFADYMLNVPVKITSALGNGAAKTIQNIGESWGDYFAFFSNPFGQTGRMMGCTPGLILMCVFALALAIWFMGKASSTVKVLTACSFIMLFMATNTFPWNSLARHFSIFNFLAQVQFPWRYVILAVLFLSILLGVLLQEKLPEHLFDINMNRVCRTVMAAGIFMVLLFSSFYVDNANRMRLYDAQDLNSYALFMSEEYFRTAKTPEGIIEADQNVLSGRPESAEAEYVYTSLRNGTDLDINVKTGQSPAVVNAPLFNYRGYEAFDDQGTVYEISDSDKFLVSFQVPENYEGTIHIRFKTPWIWNAAIICSIMTALAMGAFLLICKKRRPAKEIQKAKSA